MSESGITMTVHIELGEELKALIAAEVERQLNEQLSSGVFAEALGPALARYVRLKTGLRNDPSRVPTDSRGIPL